MIYAYNMTSVIQAMHHSVGTVVAAGQRLIIHLDLQPRPTITVRAMAIPPSSLLMM